jgi:flavin-dependent dehydrogenase
VLSRTPPAKALAESLPPSAVRAIERLGLTGQVRDAVAVQATGNTAWWGAGAERVERFAVEERGWQVERGAFDRALVEAARVAGADVRRAVVRGVERDAEGTWAIATDGDVVRARWVLDCSGRAGVLARRGFRRASEVPRTTAFVGVWERERWELADATHTLVESFAEGWAWSVPVSPTRRFVTVMVDRDAATDAERGALAAAYGRALATAPRMARLVDGARMLGEPWARDASVYDADRRGDEGALLLGDAAAFSDPLSSFGVKKAIASARLAAVVAHGVLDDATLAGPGLALFTTRERTMSARLAAAARATAAEACAAHGGNFWGARAAAPAPEMNADGLRLDREAAREAMAALRARASSRLQLTEAVRPGRTAAVRGMRLVLEPCLVAPACPDGLRWLGNVDVVALSSHAGALDDVPAVWEAYNRDADGRDVPRITLPEMLGALARLIAADVLRFA